MNAPRRPRRGGPMERALYGWHEDAACRGEDVDLFFTPGYEGEAKAVCRGCPVRDACLEYALTRPERYGVLGGLDERERASLRRRRMRQAAASGVAS